MTYANVATAKATAATVLRMELALEHQAALRIEALVNASSDQDQRERTLCQRVFSDAGVPQPYVDMVLIFLDLNGLLASATDAQVLAAVQQLWPRMIALVS